MSEEKLIPVNIVIGDRNYPIKIKPSDEETVRKTLKTINDMILKFKVDYAGKDMQDYIAMVLLWYATQAQTEGSQWQQNELKQQLDRIEKLLEEERS
jgi:hypothetical protein